MIATAPAATRLPDVDGVALALFELDQPPAALAELYVVLDPPERERAQRFRFARDRDRFVARRGQLRARLGAEVGELPGMLRIAADRWGKPFLPDHPGLHFNLSYSHGLALCAIGDRPVGCDIEWRNAELACPGVAERFFAPAESAALAGLPPGQWLTGFYSCWTRKEAFVKAVGLGLSYPLYAFAVSVDAPARLIEGGAGWSLSSFVPAPGFHAALVTADGERAPVV